MTDEIKTLIEPLRRVDQELTSEVEQLEARLAATKDKLKRVRAAIRSLDPPTPKSKPNRRKWKPVSDDAVRQVEAAIREGHETIPAIRGVTGYSDPTVGAAIRVLRDGEVIRKAGVGENRAHIYKPINNGGKVTING